MFDERAQGPKGRGELIRRYGRDIRRVNEDDDDGNEQQNTDRSQQQTRGARERGGGGIRRSRGRGLVVTNRRQPVQQQQFSYPKKGMEDRKDKKKKENTKKDNHNNLVEVAVVLFEIVERMENVDGLMDSVEMVVALMLFLVMVDLCQTINHFNVKVVFLERHKEKDVSLEENPNNNKIINIIIHKNNITNHHLVLIKMSEEQCVEDEGEQRISRRFADNDRESHREGRFAGEDSQRGRFSRGDSQREGRFAGGGSQRGRIFGGDSQRGHHEGGRFAGGESQREESFFVGDTQQFQSQQYNQQHNSQHQYNQPPPNQNIKVPMRGGRGGGGGFGGGSHRSNFHQEANVQSPIVPPQQQYNQQTHVNYQAPIRGGRGGGGFGGGSQRGNFQGSMPSRAAPLPQQQVMSQYSGGDNNYSSNMSNVPPPQIPIQQPIVQHYQPQQQQQIYRQPPQQIAMAPPPLMGQQQNYPHPRQPTEPVFFVTDQQQNRMMGQFPKQERQRQPLHIEPPH
uniref:Uncharacterized protein n=1 Tax=Meloidogyne enterolobii TaxID=390850 RepID=A0A6V7WBD8_MELEN|nr:unnamed protein product [Meloidogyne enterolobii]